MISTASEITKGARGGSAWTRPSCALKVARSRGERMATALVWVSPDFWSDARPQPERERARGGARAAAGSAGGVVNVSLRNVQKVSPPPLFRTPRLWTNSIGANWHKVWDQAASYVGRLLRLMSAQGKELTKSIWLNIVWDISREEEKERGEGRQIV